MDDEGYVVKDSLFWTSPLPQIDQHMLTPFAINTRTKKKMREMIIRMGSLLANHLAGRRTLECRKQARRGKGSRGQHEAASEDRDYDTLSVSTMNHSHWLSSHLISSPCRASHMEKGDCMSFQYMRRILRQSPHQLAILSMAAKPINGSVIDEDTCARYSSFLTSVWRPAPGRNTP